MLEGIAFWGTTVVASVSMDIVKELRVFKYAADDGYRINLEKAKEYDDSQSDLDVFKKATTHFIPVYNVLHTMNETKMFNDKVPTLLNQLHVMDLLEPMSDEEKEQYNKKPGLFNAFKLNMNHERKIEKADYVTVIDHDKEETIYYEEDKDNGNINILRATGNLDNYTEKEQIHKVEEIRKQKAELLKLKNELLNSNKTTHNNKTFKLTK